MSVGLPTLVFQESFLAEWWLEDEVACEGITREGPTGLCFGTVPCPEGATAEWRVFSPMPCRCSGPVLACSTCLATFKEWLGRMRGLRCTDCGLHLKDARPITPTIERI